MRKLAIVVVAGVVVFAAQAVAAGTSALTVECRERCVYLR